MSDKPVNYRLSAETGVYSVTGSPISFEVSSQGKDIPDSKGAIAGAGSGTTETTTKDMAPRKKRSSPGKTYLHGADRTVRYYKPTEAELDRLGDLSRDEIKARTAMGFCAGILVNIALGGLLAGPVSAAAKGAAIAVGICAAIGLIVFFLDARNKRADGNSALEKVKSEHDFANI